MKKNRSFLMFIIMILFSVTAVAQVTTSAISGKVTSDGKSPLPGATVVAVHQPSGSQYATIANSEGYFNLQGMRPGGPYNVKVSFVGYSSLSYTDITLSLGESFLLNATLKEDVTEVSEVMVVGAKPSKFSAEKKLGLQQTSRVNRCRLCQPLTAVFLILHGFRLMPTE